MILKHLHIFLVSLLIISCGIFETNIVNAQNVCDEFDVWVGEECRLGECYPEYQISLWIQGESPNGYLIYNNITEEMEVIENNVFITDWMWVQDSFSYTISTLYPAINCSIDVAADSSLCPSKKEDINFDEYFAGQAEPDTIEYTSAYLEPVTISVLDNDRCVASCIIGVTYPTDNGELVINSDCTITFYPEPWFVGVETYEYYYLDYNGNYIVGELTVSYPPFFVEPEYVCDKETGTFDLYIIAITTGTESGYTWSECGSDTYNEIVFQDGYAIPVMATYSAEWPSEAFCFNFYDANGEIVHTIQEDAGGVSCVTTSLDLLDFSGQTENNSNLLKWSTANEDENANFILERSYDGGSFEEIARINASGNSNTQKNYSFVDDTFAQSLAYYRLIAVDFDGVEKIVSNIIRIENRVSISSIISVSPVPSKDHVNIELQTQEAGNMHLNLFSITGTLVSEKRIQVEEGQNQANLNIEHLPKGIYMLQLSSDTEQWTTRIIKD